MGDTRRIRITTRPTHSKEDVRYIYNQFKTQCPAEHEAWMRLEADLEATDTQERRDTFNAMMNFVRTNNEAEDTFAVAFFLLDMRRIFAEELGIQW